MISYAPLRQLLEDKGLLSLKQFEQTFGLSSDVYYKIDKDAPIMMSTLDTICLVLGEPIEDIVVIMNEQGSPLAGKIDDSTDSVTIDQKTVLNVKVSKLEEELQELKVINAQLEASLAAERRSSNENIPYSTLSQRIKFKRQEKEMSVAELASIVGIAPLTIYKLEDGTNTNPTLHNMIKLCGAFGCSLNWLATGVE